MTVRELQAITKPKEIEIPRQRRGEPWEYYEQKVGALRELQALEQIEAEQNPIRKRRMQYLFDNGILDFSNV